MQIETICMNYPNLFSGIYKKNVINLSSAEFSPWVAKVKSGGNLQPVLTWILLKTRYVYFKKWILTNAELRPMNCFYLFIRLLYFFHFIFFFNFFL